MKKIDELEYIEVKNSYASAKIALQGAHIFEFKNSKDEDLLFLSKSALFKKAKAIRGGIPICWPWFGVNENYDFKHGFARDSMFELKEVLELDDSSTKVSLLLKDNSKSRIYFDYSFELEVVFYIGKTLKIELKTKNLDKKEFTITQALHTYFLVDNISNTKVKGLDKKLYFDNVAKTYKNLQNGNIEFKNEVDRVYQDVNYPLEISDQKRVIKIDTKGSNSVVVWNPWEDVCKSMDDLSDYKTFVCVESSNAFDDEVKVKPMQTYTLSVEYSF